MKMHLIMSFGSVNDSSLLKRTNIFTNNKLFNYHLENDIILIVTFTFSLATKPTTFLLSDIFKISVAHFVCLFVFFKGFLKLEFVGLVYDDRVPVISTFCNHSKSEKKNQF